MLKHPEITQRRIETFLREVLRPAILTDEQEVSAEFLLSAKLTASEAEKGAWKPIRKGYSWGPAYARGWYRTTTEVPSVRGDRDPVLVYGEPRLEPGEHWSNAELTMWRDGQPAAGIDLGRSWVSFADDDPGEPLELYWQTYARNAETTVAGREKPRSPKPEVFGGFRWAAFAPAVWDLALEFEFSLSLYSALAPEEPAAAVVLRALNEACNLIRLEDVMEGSGKSLTRALRLITNARESLPGEMGHTLTPVGHAHLDTAWLWPLDITRFKMLHTTAVQLDLLSRYPEHVFVHSQASQYEWLERESPEVLDRVRAAIKQGRWEVVGSMWVEADCNLSGGESLVRQFLYGQRYFEKKLGVRTQDMWLPDVFGYSAALPQILEGFGIKYFLTQKLSWNQFNKIPHHTFWWQGIDGTRVWTHFPPADTYVASCTPKELVDSVRKFKDHGRSEHSLYVYGFGDGGAGPTERHVEYLRKARRTGNMPAVERKRTALQFFQEAYEKSEDLLTWAGELYFELHRGTYTSQAANKAHNRRCEFLLRDAEMLATFCEQYPLVYPASQLEEAWKLVLLNQFHDIIPGSSVREVYDDSERDYVEVTKIAGGVVDELLTRMGERLAPQGDALHVAIFHNATLPSEVALRLPDELEAKSLTTADETLPVQRIDAFGETRYVCATPQLALGTVAVGAIGTDEVPPTGRLKTTKRTIENGDYAVQFDRNGNITSIRTLESESVEIVAPGSKANLFQIFQDRPNFWSAWDIDVFALETGRDLAESESFEIVEHGPVRVAAEVVKKFGKSTIRQRISLGPTPGIRFDTEVDWHEDDTLLKVAFPLNVNAQRATYEIQFGHVERPNHQNTSWDVARFEVCAQKWADLSEGGHGAALINTGKYGYDCVGNVLRLSLLRSPKAPDPQCDMGLHRFTYVLLPHYDQFAHGDVVAAAYAINAEPRTALIKQGQADELTELPTLVEVSDRNLVVEAVKKAEDSDMRVVRLYEAHNMRGRTRLRLATPVKRAWKANLREEPIEEMEIEDGAVVVPFRPFEIITVLISS